MTDSVLAVALRKIRAEALRDAAAEMRKGLPAYDPHRTGDACFEPSHADWLDVLADREECAACHRERR